MADRSNVGWVTCAEDGCVGVQLPSGGRCWAHADAHDYDVARDQIRRDGRIDGRGVTFDVGELRILLDAAPKNDEGRPVITNALFDQATFTDITYLERVTFEGDAFFRGANFSNARFNKASFASVKFTGATFTGRSWFDHATFTGSAWFDDVTFETAEFSSATFMDGAWFVRPTFRGEASFDNVTFTGDTRFSTATFADRSTFAQATFEGDASFTGTTFEDASSFLDATFMGPAGFTSVTFADEALFLNATFTGMAGFTSATFGTASFSGATFADEALFALATFTGEADFISVSFERARQLGPMLVNSLRLDGVLCRERIHIEVGAAVLSCRRARFLAGAQLRVRWASVVLAGADLAAPSVLDGFRGLDDVDWRQSPESAWPIDPDGTPRLWSVSGADVAGLTVSSAVDLQACRFVGAHHLDQLRAEGSNFAHTPSGWRWAKRRIIAEEQDWRAARERPRGWHRSAQPPELLEVNPLVPAQIAPLYRDLRKGLEDNKDEPGAADFYYGEMEMRRHAKRQQAHPDERTSARIRGFDISAASEWAILTLYWLVSGYGLRAWRALASLAAVVLAASVIFAFWGFAAPDQPAFRPVDVDAQGALIYQRQQVDQSAGLDELPTALRFSAQATTALLRSPDVRPLNAVGEWLTIALRLVGPVLLGLAVLSVRGRVKR